jgi:hypothetical protein
MRLGRALDEVIEDLALHALDLEAISGAECWPFLRPRRLAKCLKEPFQSRDTLAHYRKFTIVPNHGFTSTIPRKVPSRVVCRAQLREGRPSFEVP